MKSRTWLALLGVVLASLVGTRTAAAGETDDSLAGWLPVADARLAQMRGGFTLPSGFQISFGIERAVFVNEQLVATTHLQVNDPAHLSQSMAEQLAGFEDQMLVQVGSGNTYHRQGVAGLVIQNSADQQAIRTVTTLDVGVGTLGLFKLANAEASLQNALANAALSP